MKIKEAEEKNNKLEEINLDYERKLISLEGTIEQLEKEQKNKDQLIYEIQQSEDALKMNHQVSIECLQGKISTLESEIKELDANKSKNEAIIFGLETEISNLNRTVEKLKAEKCEFETSSKKLQSCLDETKEACENHNKTITELKMELG